MFNKALKKKAIDLAIFLISYTLIFILFFSTISYTIPFVLALIIAFAMKPMKIFIEKKFKLKNWLSSLIATILVFTLVFLAASFMIYQISYESKEVIDKIPNISYADTTKYFSKLQDYYNKIDPDIANKIQQQFSTVFSGTLNLTSTLLTKVVSFAIQLPVILMIIFITLLATYFFSKDLPHMKGKFLSIFSPEGEEKVRLIWLEANKMLLGYTKAYMIIIGITFLETLIGFFILRIPYAFLLSLLAAFFDVLPILGIGLVYLPLIVFYLVSGNYFTAIGLTVLYLLITAIRQIIEPKLMSSSLGLHPVAVLAAIYIGLRVYGFIGMIFLLFLMVFYNILKKVHIL